jgi:hypothetical protein
MSDASHPPDDDYVGAPTEFADAQEVPRWVGAMARLLFFLPAACVTATTIPLILLGLCLVCVALGAALLYVR